MGLTHKRLVVKADPTSRRKAVVKSLVDSGATLTLIPAATLKQLGVRPYREEHFTLADGSEITRQIGGAYVELNGKGTTTDVIFGEPGDEPLLGVTTLELLGFVLDPFKRRLLPARMMLAKSTRRGCS